MVVLENKFYDVIYVIETTLTNGVHFQDLKNNYLLPSVRFFNNNIEPNESDWFLSEGSGSASQYSLITFNNGPRFGSSVTARGVTKNPSEICKKLNNLKFLNGSLSEFSLLGEALAKAIHGQHIPFPAGIPILFKVNNEDTRTTRTMPIASQFESLAKQRESATPSIKHVIMVANQPPYDLPVVCHSPYQGMKFDQLLDAAVKTAGNEAANIIEKGNQYAVNPNHSVYFKGIQLPVQEDVEETKPVVNIKTADSPVVRKAENNDPNPNPTKKPKVQESLPQQPQQPQPPVQKQPQPTTNQPSFTPAPPVNRRKTREQPLANQTQQQQSDKKLVWTGQLQWHETTFTDGEQGKSITRILPCHASIASNETLKTDTWPATLQMQLIPQSHLVKQHLERFLKPAKKVTFQFLPSDNEVLQAMYRVMMGGGVNGAPNTGQKFAGCVIMNPPNPPSPNHVKVLLLFFSTSLKAFVGVIPDEQASFVKELGAIIAEEKKEKAKQQQQNFVTQAVRNQRHQAALAGQLQTSTTQQQPQQPPPQQQQQMGTNQINSQALLRQQLQQQLQQGQTVSQLRNLLTLQQPNSLQNTNMQQSLTQQQIQQNQTQALNNQMVNANWKQQQQQQQQQQQLRNQFLVQQQQQQQKNQMAAAVALLQQQQQRQSQQAQQLTDVQLFNDFLGTG